MIVAMKPVVLYAAVVSILALTTCAKEAATKETEESTKVEQALPTLIDLGAKQCIPCKQMAPILDELTEEYKGVLRVEFIDVWQSENQVHAKAYGIKSIPTQIFLDAKGKELWRHEGFISKTDILKKWKKLGFTFKAARQDAHKPTVPENE